MTNNEERPKPRARRSSRRTAPARDRPDGTVPPEVKKAIDELWIDLGTGD